MLPLSKLDVSKGALGALLFALGTQALHAAPGEVWVVAPSGGDFAQIQPAVSAAAEGDVILVKPGTYNGFTFLDRSLTVVAETPGTVQILGTVNAFALAETRRLSLIDLSVQATSGAALRLSDLQGSVRIRGGTWRAQDAVSIFAARFQHCDDVAIHGATFVGGNTPYNGSVPLRGGDGLSAWDSNVACHHSTFQGGDGAGDTQDLGQPGGWGGDGVNAFGGYTLLSDVILSGGAGGEGGDESGAVGPGAGGTGGDGAEFGGPGQAALLRVTAKGGAGGVGGQGFTQPDAPPGAPGAGTLALGGFPIETLRGPLAALLGDGLWRPGTPETLTVQGQPGDHVVLATSPKADFKVVGSKQGVLLLGGMPALKPLGVIPVGGVLTLTLTQFPLPAGWDGRTLELQAWTTAPGGSSVLTGSLTTAIVDPAF